jgi:nitric oxide reductase large subunit
MKPAGHVETDVIRRTIRGPAPSDRLLWLSLVLHTLEGASKETMKKLWIGFTIVLFVSFAVLGWIGTRIYEEAPPLVNKVVTTEGTVVIDEGEIQAGQNVWQSLGGMEVGSVWGHGSYVAPDWTADWLHREAIFILDRWAKSDYDTEFEKLDNEKQSQLSGRLATLMRTNTYDPQTQTVTVAPVRAAAFESNLAHYSDVFSNGRTDYAIPAGAVTDPVRLRRLSAFYFWTSWAASTNRPDAQISYTNNWPYEPLVANRATGEAVVWTGVSIIMLLAGISAMAWWYASRRESEEEPVAPETDPLGSWQATPSQKATVKYFWVEGFFEVFATTVIAFIFMRLNLIRPGIAAAAALLSATIFLSGGIIGTCHHLYFSGTPPVALAWGSVFSALEVVPLVLVGFDATEDLRRSRTSPWVQRYKWPIYFFVSVAFWNMVGAGLFGFMINPPIALYYMQGLNTTPLHGHAALFGVYGMLGIGLMLVCLRVLIPGVQWKDGLLRFSFWSLNGGLAAMCLLGLLPVGLMQTWASVDHGYWYARSSEFMQTPLMQNLRWMRVPGDTVFFLGAVALVVFVAGLKTGHSFRREQ